MIKELKEISDISKLSDLIPVGQIKTFIKSKAFYRINISPIRWRIEHLLKEFFRMDLTVFYTSNSVYDTDSFLQTDADLDTMTDMSSMIMYRNTPIWLETDTYEKEVAQGRCIVRKFFYFKTLNTPKHKEMMIEFLDRLLKLSDKQAANGWGGNVSFVANPEGFRGCLTNYKLRSFDNVFIKKEIKDQLITALENFKSKRQWFADNMIPYHFGIMIYGSPGSGKSVLAQAIVKHMHADLHVLSGDCIFELPTVMGRDIPFSTASPDSYRVILVDDIDCGFGKKKKTRWNVGDDTDVEADDRENGLASLLNCLDGMHAPTNCIYIFTTNHIEKLDQALIRPGRIDLKIELNDICDETFTMFCERHFNRTPNIKIRNGITFAELQCKLIEGYSYEDIIEYAKED